MGEMETLPYRFLVGGGGLVWLTTLARMERGKNGENSSESIQFFHTAVS
jgi:hypothetical protein